MLCVHCDSEQPDGSVRCLSCGCSLVNQAVGAPPRKKRNLAKPIGGIAVVAAACLSWLLLTGADGKARTPEDAVMKPVRALIANDLTALIATLPDDEIDKLRTKWDAERAKPNQRDDAQFNMAMAQLMAPGAVDTLMSLIEPQLEEIDEDAFYNGIEAATANAPMGEAEEMRDAVVSWIESAGFTDAGKMRQALGHVVGAAHAFNVHNAAELRALSFDDLIARSGAALPHVKSICLVYGLDVDGLLRSISAGGFSGSETEQTGTVKLTFLGKQRDIPTTVRKLDGHWFGKDKKH